MHSWLLGLYLYKSAVSYHIVAIIGGVHTVQSQMYVLLAVCLLTAVFAQVCQNSGQEVSEEVVRLVSGLLSHTEKVLWSYKKLILSFCWNHPHEYEFWVNIQSQELILKVSKLSAILAQKTIKINLKSFTRKRLLRYW